MVSMIHLSQADIRTVKNTLMPLHAHSQFALPVDAKHGAAD
jgi:hypothetical protein